MPSMFASVLVAEIKKPSAPWPLPSLPLSITCSKTGHYEDPGPDYFDKRNKDQQANKLVNCLQNLGFNVTIQHAAA